MKTIIDNSQRKFLVQNQGFGSTKDIFCNLHDIPFILSECFEPNEEYKVYEFWNRKLTRVSKKRLLELYEANKVDSKRKVKTIDISGYEWFDKVNGNSYFAAIVTLNFGLQSEVTIKIPYQYGYGDSYRYEAINEVQKLGYISDNSHTYFSRHDIIVRATKHTNCKKSELKNI